MKRIVIIIMTVVMVTTYIYKLLISECFYVEAKENVSSVKQSEVTEEAIELVNKMISAENEHDWEGYISCWCKEYADEFKSLFSDETYCEEREGILNVESAKVQYCEKVTDTSEVLLSEYSAYTDVEVYLVGIDYTVDHVTDTFYNGVNYRYIYVGKENSKYKILGCTEVAVSELEKLCEEENQGTLVYESSRHSEDDFEQALSIRTDRIKEGLVEDGNGKIVGNINDELVSKNSGESNIMADRMTCSNFKIKKCTIPTFFGLTDLGKGVLICAGKYRSNHTYKTECTCIDKSTIKVYMTETKTIKTFKNYDHYLEVVLNSEACVSKKNNEEYLKALTVCIHEYAYWNQVYYAKYPDLGYDVKNNTCDQACYLDKWNNDTKEQWKDKARRIVDAVGDVHMHTGKYSSCFESGYVDTVKTKKEKGITDGTLIQVDALQLALDHKDDNHFNYLSILNNYYNYTQQGNISNIGMVVCKKFTNP